MSSSASRASSRHEATATRLGFARALDPNRLSLLDAPAPHSLWHSHQKPVIDHSNGGNLTGLITLCEVQVQSSNGVGKVKSIVFLKDHKTARPRNLRDLLSTFSLNLRTYWGFRNPPHSFCHQFAEAGQVQPAASTASRASL